MKTLFGQSRFRRGLFGQQRAAAPFSIVLTGLSTDSIGLYGQVGNHAAIGYTKDPVTGTETVKWSNSSNPADAATYGTGAAPTDFTASDGSPVYLHVTDGGDTVTRAFTVRKAPATGGADLDLSFPEDSAISATDLLANWMTNGNTLTYVSVSPALPTGLSINSAGTMTGTPTTVTADDTYTLTMEDEYGREPNDTFALEVIPFAVSETVDGEIEITGGQPTSVTITTPTYYAGTYTTDVNGTSLASIDFSAGPACIIAPKIKQTNDADASSTINDGDTVGIGTPDADSYPGLWLYEAANGEPTITYQWQADTLGNATFANIGGATSSTYTLTSGEDGDDVRIVETATDTGGARSANSNALSVVAPSGVDVTTLDNFAIIGSQTAFTRTSVSLGAEDASREIFVFYSGRRGGGFTAADWQIAVGAVTTVTPVLTRTADGQAQVIGWRLSVPTGASANITLTRLSGTDTFGAGYWTILRTTGTPTLGTPVEAYDNALGSLGVGETPPGCEGPAYTLNTSITVSAGSAILAFTGSTHDASSYTYGGTAGLTLIGGGGNSVQGGGSSALATNVTAGSKTITAAIPQAQFNNGLLLAVELAA